MQYDVIATAQYKLIRQPVAPYFLSQTAFSHLLSTKSTIKTTPTHTHTD